MNVYLLQTIEKTDDGIFTNNQLYSGAESAREAMRDIINEWHNYVDDEDEWDESEDENTYSWWNLETGDTYDVALQELPVQD